ncbi:MAG: tetratricopeptide repeat protein, partial [Methanophagales archaeon]|nr:tetratricopeptide repeat protein [Methanophagales archaeon]
AISPFYYSSISGDSRAEEVTTTGFKERLEAEKDLGITIIDLDDPIRDEKDARYWGKKVAAHLVVYGETRKKIGNIDETIYHILPLESLASCLEIIPSEMPFLDDDTEDDLVITKKALFHNIQDPITIVESLEENASSAIYTIGAFENYRKLNFTSAITFFESIKDYDKNTLILFYIAGCYHFSSNLNESLKYYDKAIAINPQYAEAWGGKGVILGKLGRNEESLAASNKAIEINPQLAEAWNNKGIVLDDMSKEKEALAAYDKALAINPQFALLWNNKGAALRQLGRNEEAIAAYDKALEINPLFTVAWSNKGNVLADLGMYEEAIAANDKALAINPKYAGAWNNKGTAVHYLGRTEEAIAFYDKAIEINPIFAEPWKNKGDAVHYMGRTEEGIAAYDKALAIKPLYYGAWNNKGNALADLGRNEEALAAY